MQLHFLSLAGRYHKSVTMSTLLSRLVILAIVDCRIAHVPAPGSDGCRLNPVTMLSLSPANIGERASTSACLSVAGSEALPIRSLHRASHPTTEFADSPEA